MTGLLAYDPRRLATLGSHDAGGRRRAGGGRGRRAVRRGCRRHRPRHRRQPRRAARDVAACRAVEHVDDRLERPRRDAHASTSSSPLLNEQAAEPAAPFVLGAGEFSLAAAITPAEPAQWLHDVNPACVRFAGGTYLGGGYVADHRGVRYPIVVPRVETDDGDVFTADRHAVAPGEPSVATLGGSDPGWEIVGCATGVARFQEAPSLDEAASAASSPGRTGLVGPLPPEQRPRAHRRVAHRPTAPRRRAADPGAGRRPRVRPARRILATVRPAAVVEAARPWRSPPPRAA